MSGRLNIGSSEITNPAARLNSPGLVLVYLGMSGSYLTFTSPASARELAETCEAAARLLEGPQVTEA